MKIIKDAKKYAAELLEEAAGKLREGEEAEPEYCARCGEKKEDDNTSMWCESCNSEYDDAHSDDEDDEDDDSDYEEVNNDLHVADDARIDQIAEKVAKILNTKQVTPPRDHAESPSGKLCCDDEKCPVRQLALLTGDPAATPKEIGKKTGEVLARIFAEMKAPGDIRDRDRIYDMFLRVAKHDYDSNMNDAQRNTLLMTSTPEEAFSRYAESSIKVIDRMRIEDPEKVLKFIKAAADDDFDEFYKLVALTHIEGTAIKNAVSGRGKKRPRETEMN